MTENKSWGDYYAGAGDADYFLDHLTIHKDYLKEILKRKPARTLEAGCGSAIMSIFFSMTGIEATACDLDEKVLSQAALTARKWNANVLFKNQNLTSLNFPSNRFDLTFSQGVLEHMTDDEIKKSCEEILRVSKCFIFSVPSYYYRHRDFGNERLLTMNQWRQILKGLGFLEMKYYYAIRTKRNFLIKRPLMLMGILSR